MPGMERRRTADMRADLRAANMVRLPTMPRHPITRRHRIMRRRRIMRRHHTMRRHRTMLLRRTTLPHHTMRCRRITRPMDRRLAVRHRIVRRQADRGRGARHRIVLLPVGRERAVRRRIVLLLVDRERVLQPVADRGPVLRRGLLRQAVEREPVLRQAAERDLPREAVAPDQAVAERRIPQRRHALHPERSSDLSKQIRESASVLSLFVVPRPHSGRERRRNLYHQPALNAGSPSRLDKLRHLFGSFRASIFKKPVRGARALDFLRAP